MSHRRVLLHCNAGIETGRGHLMRTLAVAQRAARRGWTTSIVGDIDSTGLAIAERLAPGIRIHAAPHDALGAAFDEQAAHEVDVIHLDTYGGVPDLERLDALVSNMQDGAYGARRAGLAIDANLGSEKHFVDPGMSDVRIAGLDGAVIRSQVLQLRGGTRAPSRGPRILLVMGGTDPENVTARVLEALDRIAMPVDVTVIDPQSRPEVAAAARASNHDVTVLGFVDDLPGLAFRHDLAITAAGTSVWDFACLGIPMAAVCVVDNQRSGYRELVAHGLVAGLGEPPHHDLLARVEDLSDLLRSPETLREAGERLREAVDGLGTWRIVSAWEQLLDSPPVPAPETSLATRPASMADADVLFAWRDDPGTRAASRNKDSLDWNAHLGWMSRTLADRDRQLFVIEAATAPIATVRWDRCSGLGWEASITVAPDHRGTGVAAAALLAAERAVLVEDPCRLLATIHIDNIASRRVFARAGYLPHRPADRDGFLTLAKWRVLAASAR